LGRIDGQVKLRGFRVELGEIEAVLSQHPAVREAVVLAREDTPGDKRLVAYVVPGVRDQGSGIGDPHVESSAFSVQPSALRTFLAKQLPEHMLPAAFVTLDALPLTPSGKVDRRALPAPAPIEPRMDLSAPRSPTERRLATIWAETLGLEQVGVDDNFFDLGGHSLLGIQLLARVREQLDIQLSVRTFFETPTIAGLAALIDQRAPVSAGAWSPLAPLQTHGDQPALFCIHPVGGSVFCYVELTRQLGANQPVYGLEARGLEVDQAPLPTIAAMAAAYIAALRTVQPRGPYRLLGWSMGGTVAFEMAQQLRAQGESVALLALLDTLAPRPDGSAYDDADLAAQFVADVLALQSQDAPAPPPELRSAPIDRQLAWLAETGGSATPGEAEIARRFEVFKTNARAAASYDARRFDGDLQLFVAQESPDPSAQWRRLIAGRLDRWTIPGDHYTILRAPNVALLASALRRLIEGAHGG
jgi:thioesterase domain-containing protein/acyl carrier protein